MERNTDSSLTAEMKRAVRVDLESRYGNSELSDLLDICTFLDPQFRPAEPNDSIIENIKEEMLLSVQACPLGPLPTQECNSLAESTPPLPKRKKTWLTKILGRPEGQSAATTSPSEQVAQKMDRYLHHPIIDVESFFPLEWWKAQEKQFPLLGRLACRYLCICATSVPSERVLVPEGTLSQPLEAP